MKNAIVIDSTTKLRNDFLNEIYDKIDVRIVPVRVYINDEEFEDSDELSKRIVEAIKNKEKVETSLPNISTVESVFEELSKNYERVYVLSVSSLLSGTYSLFSTIA
ncbi:MAG: DegV family protein, partial [Fervidobacterium sp.]